MPKRKSQLSRHTSKTKSVKARRMGETSYEHTQPESNIEHSQSITGVTFVFAADFRQTLPVITKGTRANVIRACLKSSYLWSSVETINLRTNMRAHLSDNNNNDFSHQLLNLGEGKISSHNTNINSDDIKLDDRLSHILYRLEHLIDAIYPALEKL